MYVKKEKNDVLMKIRRYDIFANEAITYKVPNVAHLQYAYLCVFAINL